MERGFPLLGLKDYQGSRAAKVNYYSFKAIYKPSSRALVTTEAEQLAQDKITPGRAEFIKVIVDQPGLYPSMLSAVARPSVNHCRTIVARMIIHKTWVAGLVTCQLLRP